MTLKIMKLRKIVIGMLLASAMPVYANDISYNLIQIDIGKVSGSPPDEYPIDARAVGLGVSVELSDEFYATFSLGELRVDGGASSNTLTAGVGAHVSVSRAVDLYSEVGFARVSSSSTYTANSSQWTKKDSDTGADIAFGARVALPASFELDVGVSRMYVSDDIDNTKYASLFYHATKIGIGVSYAKTGDISGTSVSFRILF